MLTSEEKKELRQFRKTSDCDEIRFKEIIKNKLLENSKIIALLNNKELVKNNDSADAYFGVNILPYFLIKPTQTNVENYICYEVRFEEVSSQNKIIKHGEIIFNILCDYKNIIDMNTYVARHDLLAALIVEEFNWSNCFGQQAVCVSNEPYVTDTDYACRTVTFQINTTNSITHSNKIINSQIRT